MIRLVSNTLLLKAVKFPQPWDSALIEMSNRSKDPETVYCLRNNGFGLDLKYADKLIGVFQRLHTEKEFEGAGVGLAVAQRNIKRRAGRRWAEGVVNEEAAFYFSFPQKVVA